MPVFATTEADRLLALADNHLARAYANRELAADIDRRRFALESRLEPCLVRHVSAVWSSAAAEASRVSLSRVVARNIWQASQQLLAIRTALLVAAENSENHATALRRQAAEESLNPDQSPEES